jgi:hypothetical protein
LGTEEGVPSFDWHSDPIMRATQITASYRNTQNVRRFFETECGHQFKFDRSFMAWLKDGSAKTMGDAADEWLRRATAAASTRSTGLSRANRLGGE